MPYPPTSLPSLPNSLVSPQDVRNIRKSLASSISSSPYSPTQQFINIIKHHPDIFSRTQFTNQRPSHCFWAFKESIDMLKHCHRILVMDNTYKVRLDNKPLLN